VTDCVAGENPYTLVDTVEVMAIELAVRAVARTSTSLVSEGARLPGQLHVIVVPAMTQAAETYEVDAWDEAHRE
jgi:hypothetical protein